MEVLVDNTNSRCGLCPHEAEIGPIYRYPDDLSTAPRVSFRCSHTFHTHCFIIYKATGGGEGEGRVHFSCPACNQTILDQQAIDNIINIRGEQGYENIERVRVTELWNTNEAFREDVLELKKLLKETVKHTNKHAKEITILKREWRQMVIPSVAYLKSQKKLFIKKLIETEHRRASMNAWNRYNKKKREIANTYDTRWGLSFLADIPGAPNINTNMLHSRRYPFYMFRIRI